MNYLRCPVPASPSQVQSFVNENKDRYVACLGEVRNLVTDALAGIDIYKIYGREEKQDGILLKDTRKIRLKFNDYWTKKGEPVGSLWETPDVVGFTIVVSYPSDISSVCERVDELVAANRLFSVAPAAPIDSDGDTDEIRTRYGRAFRSKGYFACHYNLLQNAISPDRSPICEIQIKTLLHDAWGAKTHDLTYKAASPLDPALSKGFEILGDSLAKLDQQSDLLRGTIIKQHELRWVKKKLVLEKVSNALLDNAISKCPAFAGERTALLSVSRQTAPAEMDRLENICISEFKTGSKRWASITLFVLGFRSGHRRVLNNGREALATWESEISDDFARANAIGISGLMNYFANDPMGAIDENIRAIEQIETIPVPVDDEKKRKYFRRYHSLVSSLAYYYAEIVGSDIGNKYNAKENASNALQKVLEIRKKTKSCPNSALSTPRTLQRAINNANPEIGYSNFSSLDNELFTRIQLAETVAEVMKAYDALKNLHKNPPTAFAEAGELFDFHDYCARQRLRDLELSQTGSSSHP